MAIHSSIIGDSFKEQITFGRLITSYVQVMVDFFNISITHPRAFLAPPEDPVFPAGERTDVVANKDFF